MPDEAIDYAVAIHGLQDLSSDYFYTPRCAFRLTASAYADIVVLDNRERESLFVEAIR